jgi:hypothetical protein
MKKGKSIIPFEFVLENLSRLDFTVKAFFGCHSIYVGDKIVLTLRQKKAHPLDNGVWVATSIEHHASLHKVFPNMRGIGVFGKAGNWQILPLDANDFEESVNKVCELVIKNDPRIGRVPTKKKTKAKTKK